MRRGDAVSRRSCARCERAHKATNCIAAAREVVTISPRNQNSLWSLVVAFQPPFAYGVTLGWAAAVLAVATAYVRVLGGSLGVTQSFAGPMAKQHRMFTLTLVTVAAAGEAWRDLPLEAIRAGLAVIVAGSVVTLVRRTRRIVAEMGGR